jgi:HlyD family secretion protein
MNRLPILLVVLLAVAGAGLAWWRVRARAAEEALRFESVAVDRGPIVAKVTANGTVSALVTVLVGSQVSGRILELHADFNSAVKKDQVLARIDPLFYQATLDQAKASLTIADGNLAKARVQARDAERQQARLQQLFGEHIVTQSDLDTADTATAAARAQVTVAEGSLAQARAVLRQAEVNMDYTTILSPVDGVVISRSVDVGQTVAASLQAPTLFTIAGDLRQMQIDTSVAEGDVGKLTPDTPATFTVDAFPGERFRGTVRQIRYNAQVLQNVVTYDAVIDVANPELKLRPGMTANVTFIYAERSQVLRVPNAALRFRPPPQLTAALGETREAKGKAAGGSPGGGGGGGGRQRGEHSTDRRTVWVLRQDKPVMVPIRVGITDGTMTELLEGELVEGDRLISETVGGAPAAPAPAAAGANPFRRGF